MTRAQTKDQEHSGICRCGQVMMTASVAPDFSVYCHCDDCRRATGAPVLASIGFYKKDIEWKKTERLTRHKRGTATRLFCNNCGSPVAQEHESAADRIFINTAFMSNPEAYPPTAHTYESEQLSWLKLDDDLPRAAKTLLIEPAGSTQ